MSGNNSRCPGRGFPATDYADYTDFKIKYKEKDYPVQKETFLIIGISIEIHKILGRGFLENVYKDAFEYELRKRKISFARERRFEVSYKDIILPHCYVADFVIEEKILVEVKAQKGIIEEQYRQVINYLAISKCPVGLLINFGEDSLKYKRLIL